MIRVALVGSDPQFLSALRACGASAESVEWTATAGFDRVIPWCDPPEDPLFADWLARVSPVALQGCDPTVYEGLPWRNPARAHADDEGQVMLVFAGGELAQATRVIPVHGGPAVEQPLGLFQGEDELGREVLVRLSQRFDALLGRRSPPFLRVGVVRQQGRLVIDAVSLLGPVALTHDAAMAVARAHLPTTS